jgi:hypothetical protein
MPKSLRKRVAVGRPARGTPRYPIATIAYYGPNDRLATKLTVGIVADDSGEVVALERWTSEGSDVRSAPETKAAVLAFIAAHGAKSVVTADRIIGCPHEEGVDYPEGGKCPHCPFWASRDRWSREQLH